MTDIFAIHQLIASDISYVSPIQDDALRDVIRELGSVKSNEHEMMGVSGSEISLQLNAKLHDVEGQQYFQKPILPANHSF